MQNSNIKTRFFSDLLHKTTIPLQVMYAKYTPIGGFCFARISSK